MIENSQPFQSILTALSGLPKVAIDAPIYALTSPFTQSGTSHVCRSLALLAAQHYAASGGRVALIDFDINQQTQAETFDTPRSIGTYGALQGPYDATFGKMPFWQVSPDMVADSGERTSAGSYCGLHFVGETGLAVSKFEWDVVKSGQAVHVMSSPDYWQAIRQQFSAVFVDCPAMDRTDIALNIIPYADSTMIIAPNHRANDPEIAKLSELITKEGGQSAGVVLNAGKAVQPFSGYVP